LTSAQQSLSRLRAALDRRVAGHADAKHGLVLALVAGEHAYLEGPPGCAKTRLAEALAELTGARTAAIRFHRDTSAADLLGAPLLEREGGYGRERVRQRRLPGALASAQLLVLDDLSRAPGEALAPLWRLLAERRLEGRATPLETAVATALPAGQALHADPLTACDLDCFAVQLRVSGLLAGRRWDDAARLLEAGEGEAEPAVLDDAARGALREAARRLPIAPELRAAYLRLVAALVERAGPHAAPLGDRSFGRAALAVLRANALVRGSSQVEPRDLVALRAMLGRRLPAAVVEQFDDLLAAALAAAPAPAARAQRGERSGEGGAGAVAANDATGELEPLPGAAPSPAAAPLATARVAPLVRSLEGELERAAVEAGEEPGGQPRELRRMRNLEEIFDADPVEAALWLEGALPDGPRAWKRERRVRGGRLAVLRDVSASMEGRLALWAGQIVAGIVQSGARHQMRIGYLEFNHRAERHGAGSTFFHRRYRMLLALAARRRAEGRTSFEAPLRLALEELRGGPRRQRHVVLLTDGVPVEGDPEVRHERALARRLGVRVHTVFLGLGECPPVLDRISSETGGLRFAARPGAGGELALRERGAPA
jgi:MoxR-like ATPase